MCTANNTDVYLISGSTLMQKLTSSGSGTVTFTGGSCTNCGVAFDAATNQAVIELAIASDVGGFQFLDLAGTPTFEKAFKSQSPTSEVSEDIAIDPTRHLLLSPNESATYELLNIATSTSPQFFENDLSSSALRGIYDSAGEDCSTGVALATDEFTGDIYLADLNQATFTPGSPAGTWSAPQKLQHFPEFVSLSAGTSAIAAAGGSHIAVVNGEFGGNLIGAVQLPSTPGTGGAVPAATDYIVCTIPKTPDKLDWSTGDDPHTTTAYVSPNSGDAIALVADSSPPTFVALIDMTKLLNPTIVPRINNGFPSAHTCDLSKVNLQAAGVVRFVAVP